MGSVYDTEYSAYESHSYDTINKHSRNESSTSTILADIDPIDLDDVLGEVG